MAVKDGMCSNCTLYSAEMVQQEQFNNVDILVVGPSPTKSDLEYGAFRSKQGYMLRTIFRENTKALVYYTYAVKCYSANNIDVDTIHKCSVHLLSLIDRINPKVIIALDTVAVKGLGFKDVISAIRGSTLYVKNNFGKSIPVIPTYSLEQVSKAPGYFPVFKNDVLKAIKIASNGLGNAEMTLHTPTMFEEVEAALQQAYEVVKEKSVTSGKKVVLAVDTETTSLKPYLPNERVIAVSLSWERMQGMAFPLEHGEANFDKNQIARLINLLTQLLTSPYVILLMNNGKFDMQWLKYKYNIPIPSITQDTMLLEHILEEDKKGDYSLKSITKDRFPYLGGYEDELQEFFHTKRKELIEKRNEEIKNLETQLQDKLVDWWKVKSDEERTRILSELVDLNLVKISEVIDLPSNKTRITKKYKKIFTNFILRVPVERLEEIDNTISQYVNKINNEINELKKEVKLTYEDIPIDVLLKYAAIDALTTRLIFEDQLGRLQEDTKNINRINKILKKPLDTLPIYDAYKNITMPLCNVLTEMEYYGITLDRDKTKKYIGIIEEKMEELKDKMYTQVGYRFNFSSSASDLSRILYEEMKLPTLKNTVTGKASTDAEVLKELYDKYDVEFIADLLVYRKLDKCLTTYLKNWLQLSELDGKLHGSYNQIGTATYRLSSSNPNLQNVPFQLKEAGLNLKALFIPDNDEYEFYDLDISNAEMRVLCGYSKDDTLISVFNEGKDIHCLTAAGISEYSYEDILANKEDKTTDHYMKRQIAKKVNFGTIYCMSALTLKEKLWSDMRISITEKQAQEYLDKFFRQYPGVLRYINETQEFVYRYKFTYTYTGRRRRFPIVNYMKSQLSRMSRQAVNARIQTTSADLVALNIININKEIQKLGGRVLITVHDSIGFQLPKGVTGIKNLLDNQVTNNIAETQKWLPVQWKYDVSKGPNYGEAHDHVS